MNYRNVHDGAARLGADVSGSGGWVLIRSLMWLSTNWNGSQAMGTEQRERKGERQHSMSEAAWSLLSHSGGS